jgi:hypothetical protein
MSSVLNVTDGLHNIVLIYPRQRFDYLNLTILTSQCDYNNVIDTITDIQTEGLLSIYTQR